MKLKDEVKRARLIEQELSIIDTLIETVEEQQDKLYLMLRRTRLLGEEQ